VISRNHIIIDPDELEERCMDGKVVIGINKHLEICMMELNGSVSILKDEVYNFLEIHLRYYLLLLLLFY
jgi:exosome complex RNA-binding protein Rrp42 (RNase PH superfamily)